MCHCSLNTIYFVPGFYCGSTGLTEVSAPCEPGFYCPGGQASSYEYNCTLGAYCPEGMAQPIMCERGTFQDQTGQSECTNCTGRFYCDPFEFAVGSNDTGIIIPLSCPQGYYCPEGTGAKNSFPCLPGTYGGGTELIDARKCRTLNKNYVFITVLWNTVHGLLSLESKTENSRLECIN